ncbi:MAG: DUF2179 domain-containing protein, partial [Deltaproteobacteria bacterium]|nr:DUF2179 domain-containing protein [Deltaproteobacteria bacterium]
MEWFNTLPVWGLALLIFCLRITDVSMGTLRTISVVQGRISFSVVLGFFEVLLWAFAVSQVITRLQESPILLLAYAGGFAAGNAVGIGIERALAMGSCVVRIVTARPGTEIAASIRATGQPVTSFLGHGLEGDVTLLYMVCPRRKLPKLIQLARSIDPALFYSVEPVQSVKVETGMPLPHATGWRAVIKKK